MENGRGGVSSEDAGREPARTAPGLGLCLGRRRRLQGPWPGLRDTEDARKPKARKPRPQEPVQAAHPSENVYFAFAAEPAQCPGPAVVAERPGRLRSDSRGLSTASYTKINLVQSVTNQPAG